MGVPGSLPRSTWLPHASNTMQTYTPGKILPKKKSLPWPTELQTGPMSPDLARREKKARGDRAALFRAGIFATMKNNLTAQGQRLLPLIERAVDVLCVAPTALIFKHIVVCVLRTLLAQVPPERKAAKALQQRPLRNLDLTCFRNEICTRPCACREIGA